MSDPNAPFILLADLRLYLAYAPAASPERLREYLPAGESFERWNRLASVRIFTHLWNPREYLEAVSAVVLQSHPNAAARLLEHQESKALVLDFMTFGSEPGTPFFAEWNLMRAEFFPGVGLTVYQYAMRMYEVGPECGPIVHAERERMLGAFQSPSLPLHFRELGKG